ncbi:Na+/H+ antiporter NhaA [Sphingomonas piscis]|uniref:Na(+)/H(+) antiporter NhaA n=1 Tax=Sphingomonas piscis TaxID=2714943 RepID=A0A6G7YPB0_9SPHN|nr:Na+/H+ antiporter NhaA [Sphingomonas piscis]QIK78567.1 Na+/H+ antiporter NhaA [Sphingomonas piscis]
MADAGDIQRSEKRAGLLLMAAAAAALLLANGPAAGGYDRILHLHLGPSLPRLGVPTVHEWVADGLMAIFFLLVGLEVKREWFEGRLSTPAERRLPIVAAAAGMAVPALIYLAVTGFDPALAPGWAIPSATDIAFAVGVLALLGDRASPSLKLLLVAIAIVDDIGAVIIIAVAYTADLDATAIGIALAITGAMALMSLFGVRRLWPFLVGFALLWLAMLASGIHATIAGVVAALTIPLGRGEPQSPLRHLEHAIHPWVMFGIMPLFGLASAGVHFGGAAALSGALPLGIALGLFVGKQLGVFAAVWLTVKLTGSVQPPGTRWTQIYGASLLCGVGFTMSLFIGALAFPGEPDKVEAAKIGTLAGSLLSAVAGFAVLRFVKTVPALAGDDAEAREIFGEDVEERS